MSAIDFSFLNYFYPSFALSGLLASIFVSLRSSGDAGVPRLIERANGKSCQLLFWKDRWDLLCKSARLLLTFFAIATFVTFYLAVRHLDTVPMIASLLLMGWLYMLVARVIPHVLSEGYADRITLASLPFMGLLTLLMYPFVYPLQFVESRLTRHAMKSSDDEDRPSTEDEIKSLIEETDEEALEEEEREIIRSVFEFGETVAREIMIPRINISGLKDDLRVDECVELVKESRHSRFPVFHENIDDVIGLIHVKDLLKLLSDGESAATIGQIAKRIEYVPETMPLNDLLQLMKKARAQMVLVVDEYGGTEGLVTMEDVIEELVGEIEDEYDPREQELHQRSDGSVMALARTPIYDLNEKLGAKLPESDEYDSLGGVYFRGAWPDSRARRGRFRSGL